MWWLLFACAHPPPQPWVAPLDLHAATDPAPVRAARQRAMAAYEDHNLLAYYAAALEAAALRPDHAGHLYNLASAEALIGLPDDAFATLERLVALQVALDFTADDDFASLRADPRFGALAARMATLAEPIGSPDTLYTLEDADFLLEGLAHDPATGRLFAGSVHRGAILAFPGGQPFAEGLDSVLGMAVDPAGTLWACTAVLPQLAGDRPDRSTIVGLDLADGTERARHVLPHGSRCNDVTWGDGILYVGDTGTGAVWELRDGALTVFLKAGSFGSPQGLAYVGTTLWVADYGAGLFSYDRAHRTPTTKLVADVPLLGIDGLAAAGGSLLVIQNGIAPARVVRLDLEAGHAHGHTLIRGTPGLGEPTLGVVVGPDFYFVANSGWERFPDDGTVAPAARGAPAIVSTRW